MPLSGKTFFFGISCGTYLKFEREDSITKQKILNDPDVKDTLRRLHDDFVLAPADKAVNNVIVDKNLPYSYWTPKLRKVPFKHCFIAGFSKYITKDLSCLLTKVLITVKDGLIRYNNIIVCFCLNSL